MFRRRKFTSQRVRTKRRKIVIDSVSLLLALAGAVILLLSQISMLRALTISDIEVRGNEQVQTETIERSVRKELSGYYLGLFSRANTVLFSRSRIVGQIYKTSPRIASVDVDLEHLQKISVTVMERDSVGVWCDGVFGDSGSCYFLDSSGFLYARAPSFTSTFFLEFYGDLTDNEPVGGTFLKNGFVRTRELIETVSASGVEVKALSVVSSEQHELRVEDGARIIYDPNDGYDTFLENLSLVLSSNEFRTEAGDNRLLLIDYIDLRFGNKVFYKFEDE